MAAYINAYFQIIYSEGKTYLRVFPAMTPKGEALNAKELNEYLSFNKINIYNITYMEEVNRIGQKFSTFGLFKFVLPAFFTNLFSQLFKSLDDALFISRFVGPKALAALNLLTPLNCIQLAFSHLCSLGAATISARYMGQKKQEEAKQVFSKIIVAALIIGAIFGLLINVFSKPILFALGADEELFNLALYQVRLVYGIAPIVLLNAVFSLYFSTSGQPKMGMICSIVNGTTNIMLDLILITYLKIGVLGAAIATVSGEIAVFLIGVIFFINKNHEIYFVKPIGEIINTCFSSFKYALPQCINSLSFSVTAFITNKQLLTLAGSDGVAANAIISDIRSIMMSGLIGMAASLGPVVAYNYGRKDVEQLRKTLFSILKIWLTGSVVLMTIGFALRTPLVQFFMSKDSTQQFYEMALFGITIEIFSIPFASGCITTSRLFISLNNAKGATMVSVCRNLIFRAFSLLILPYFLKITGVWLAIPVAEFISFLFASILIYINRNNYGYGKTHEAYMLY